MLALLDPKLQFVVEVGSSDVGVGAIPLQKFLNLFYPIPAY